MEQGMPEQMIADALLDRVAADGFEEVVFAADPGAGYRAIIAVHSTRLGPALGGARLHSYASDAQALTDVLRLARGMTYKCAAAGIPLGGGKAVIIGNPKPDARPHLFRAHGKAVDRLGGRYITAIDIGTSPDDMTFVRETTSHVACLPSTNADPSPRTARGVLRAIEAALEFTTGSSSLKGKTVAVQGLGHVGYSLARQLSEKGAKLLVYDVNSEQTSRAHSELGASITGENQILSSEVDVFAPCAFGAVLNEKTIPRLGCKIVAGAANNQLAVADADGIRLRDRNITYVPDFIANAGGAIFLTHEILGWDSDQVAAKVDEIFGTTLEVLQMTRQGGLLPHEAAERVAERRLGEGAVDRRNRRQS
jgi:leucine dehydrogenase